MTHCACGEMDITAVFGTVILGSSPGRRTNTKRPFGLFVLVRLSEPSAWLASRTRRDFRYRAAQQGEIENHLPTWSASPAGDGTKLFVTTQ